MNITEKMPTPKDATNDAIELIIEEKSDTFRTLSFFTSLRITVSTRKSSPSDGNVDIRNPLISSRGTDMDCAALSTFTIEMSFAIPAMIGIIVATMARKMAIIMMMVRMA